MIIENQKDLKKLQTIGAIVADCLEYMLDLAVPGMSTGELDRLGEDFLTQRGARSAPRVMYDFPGATCISLQHEAAHGIPRDDNIIPEGALLNIDVSAVKDDIYADTGKSIVLPNGSRKLQTLCEVTAQIVDLTIASIRAQDPLNKIGSIIEKQARKHGYTIIRNLCSHGVGKTLHDDPQYIPSYCDKKDRRRLQENMVITIEPFLSTGTQVVEEAEDGWTLNNTQSHYSAQREHTIVIRKNNPLVITLPS